ncbi:acid protease [Sistotremastrum suecicum HHB10207 ss-3]|uniref:Acid protease n=1 Tax=Sistotremastrum suecicum HHB10207 ss-3 TaxID=1314776 RepID=A0A166IQT9_9AGAM|nr:acid protease [Sistotremastrum suecicum HHB10207 ss-3]
MKASIPLQRVLKSRISNATISKSSLSDALPSISLFNSREFAYLASISIGGQNFIISIDTGSSDLWVVSSTCADADCQGVPSYSPSNSMTPTNTIFKLGYLTGNVLGNVAYDTVILGNFQVASQVFAFVNQTTGIGLSSTGNSGILGLSFPQQASISSNLGFNLIFNIFSNLDEQSRLFGIRLGRGVNDSALTIGGHDLSLLPNVSQIRMFDVIPKSTKGSVVYDYWKLSLTGLLIIPDSVDFPLSPSKIPGASQPIAVLDTGTTLILGPSKDVQRLWKAVGGARLGQDGNWQIPCNMALVLAFKFGDGGVFAVDPTDLSWSEDTTSDGWCLAGVQANDKVVGGDWLLGDTFMRNVYVEHYGATNTTGPRLGMLNLTDANSSLSAFTNSRGSGGYVIPTRLNLSSSLSDKISSFLTGSGQFVSLIIACVLGFLVGGLVTALVRSSLRALRRKRRKLRYM